MLKLCVIILSTILLWLPVAAISAERVALVVGNSKYTHAPSLPNPRNDATDISMTLTRLGFKVTTVTDLGFEAMRKALLTFSSEAINAEMAVVFYAGHRMEVNNQNYLVGDQVTLADLALLNAVEMALDVAPGWLDSYPLLKVNCFSFCNLQLPH